MSGQLHVHLATYPKAPNARTPFNSADTAIKRRIPTVQRDSANIRKNTLNVEGWGRGMMLPRFFCTYQIPPCHPAGPDHQPAHITCPSHAPHAHQGPCSRATPAPGGERRGRRGFTSLSQTHPVPLLLGRKKNGPPGAGRGGGLTTEEWAPLPRVFHNTNELRLMRRECETASVMSALCGPWLESAR